MSETMEVTNYRTEANTMIEDINLNQASQTFRKIVAFQDLVQKTLVDGKDYGIIPGTKKPTLYKPGAEKIVMILGLSSNFEILEKEEDFDNGFFAYTVKCQLLRNGLVVAEGIGHCNSKEGKYAYRWQDGQKVENDDPYTLVNTLIKMAKKRAFVDAALTVGSLSDLFTQDLEDMQGEKKSEKQKMASDAQCKLLWGRAKQYGINQDALIGYVKKTFDCEISPKQLKSSSVNPILKWIEKVEKEG